MPEPVVATVFATHPVVSRLRPTAAHQIIILLNKVFDMNVQCIIAATVAKLSDIGGVQQVFLVACGGSLVDMYPAKYFLDGEALTIRNGIYTANEFVYAAPASLGENSVVIVCSHGGNTPESVAAAELAQQRGATTIILTHNPQADLLRVGEHSIIYAWGNDSSVEDNPMAIILGLSVEILQQTQGYAHYAAFQRGVAQIDRVVVRARAQVSDRSERFAERYQHESLFYILSSGASYGHAYGFAICSLMEMQWLNAAPIHSGEFFHGPFEVTDRKTPFILMMNQGRTRALDERVLSFLQQYADKVEVIDAKELGIGRLPPEVVEYFNPVLFYSVMCEYRAALALRREHPLETRRYMGQVAY